MATGISSFYLSIVNGAQKLLAGVTTGGTANANAIPALNAQGQLDITMMPTGVGSSTQPIVASEALGSGAFVSVWNNAGTPNVRNADGSTYNKVAHGFVLSAVASGATATVYLAGLNTALSGLTPGDVFLSDTTIGGATSTPPTVVGHTLQRLGVATSASVVDFTPQVPIQL